MTSSSAPNWAGKRLGLPESGAGSIAKMPRRILAIFVDWAAASLLSFAFFKYDSWATLLLFTSMQWLFVATLGGSIGHRLTGLRVVRLDGSWIGPWRSLGRALLLALVIPVAVWDSDNRGLHDKAAGTALVLA
jgi:uncharacterized RDD family membrane protein YckC